MTDPRITKGCELLAAYEDGCLAQVESTEDRDELEQRHDDLQEFLADNADFFLRDLPARVAELEEGMKYYANTFCELGPFDECCGRLTSDECSGCRAASLLEGKAADSIPISALTPPNGVDRRKLEEIRARHERTVARTSAGIPIEVRLSDVAALLAMLDGGRDDAA